MKMIYHPGSATVMALDECFIIEVPDHVVHDGQEESYALGLSHVDIAASPVLRVAEAPLMLVDVRP